MEESGYERVPAYNQVDKETFKKIVDESHPAILTNCDFGDCMTKWDLDYLTERLTDREIVIHESPAEKLEFISKNFRYETCTFQQFSDKLKQKCSNSGSVYLRSTNTDEKSKKPARIEDDFPAISNDLKPPSFIPFGKDNKLYHSSVLRIASVNTQVWTHFDLYDNILCQVTGMKRVILFEPGDSKYLYVDGDKSEVNNFDTCSKPLALLRHTNPRLCYLRPGECLFIPSLWWHNIRSVVNKTLDPDFGPVKSKSTYDSSPNHSIGFNIFWRNPELVTRSLYADGDIYGNKNLIPYDNALTHVDRGLKQLEKLPGKYREFHQLLLWRRIKKKLGIVDELHEYPME